MHSGMNFQELVRFKTQLEDIQKQIDIYVEQCAKELAARLLAKVIKRTPVGKVHGGTLRRGWTGGSNATAYANSLSVRKNGGEYTIDIINPVEYAEYVEYGHRTRNHKKWVPGIFMLTLSEKEIQSSAPKILENKIKKIFEGMR